MQRLEPIKPTTATLDEIARSMIAESRLILVTGARRSGKTTVAKALVAKACVLGSRIGGMARPWGISPDDQLGPLFEVAELDGQGARGMPSWAPAGVYPYRYRGCYLVDEAQSYAEGAGRRSLGALVQRSGPRGLSGVLTSQRCADLAQACPPAAKLFDWVIGGEVRFNSDADYLEHEVGIDPTPLIRLEPHVFKVYKLFR